MNFDTFYNREDLLSIGTSWSRIKQEIRLDTYLNNLNRYEGKNDLLELNLDVTYPSERAITRVGIPLMRTINVNLYQKITKKWVDLIFGEEIKIKVDEQYQEQVDRYLKNGLLKQAKNNQMCCSIYGNSVYKIVWDDVNNQALIQNQSPNSWTPIVRPENPEIIDEHVITWTYQKPVDKTFSDIVLDYAKKILFLGQINTDKYIMYLQAEIYDKNKVTNKLYKLGTMQDGIFNSTVYGIAQEIALPEGMPEEIQTGIDDFLIYSLSNIDSPNSVFGLDDYTCVTGIVDGISEVITKFTHDIKHQGNILETDIVNKAMIEQGLINLVNGVIFRATKEQAETQKITWDVQHESVIALLDKLSELFYLQSDLNPALFGDIKQGFADSGIAIKRLMANTLQVASEKAQKQKHALEWAIKTASKLEASRGVGDEITEVNIEFQDGLINDLTELINQNLAMYEGGLISQEKAIMNVQGLEGDLLVDEIAKIKADKPETEQGLNMPTVV